MEEVPSPLIPSSPPPIPPFPPPPIPYSHLPVAVSENFPQRSLSQDSPLPIARQLDHSLSHSNTTPDYHDMPVIPVYENDNYDEPHLISSFSNDSAPIDVTDKDFFLRLGYEEGSIRDALIITSGDRNAALYILSKSSVGLKGLFFLK